MGHDPAAVEGRHLAPGTVRRAAALALPYRMMLTGFLAAQLLGALAFLVPPILFGRIIDEAIPAGDRWQLNVLAAIIVAAAFCEAGLSFIERWWSARIGEGLIFDLRVGLYDHVQRMPIAFFTHVQTGSLISRMNNDVIGAQRAFTGTLSSVVSNTIVLATTLVAMLALEWRLTLLALALLPVFIAPTKRVGRRLQALTRQSMEHNAAMNTVMTERLNVAGALLVKLFGRHDIERAGFSRSARTVRDIGVRSALYGRAFFIGLSLVGAVGAAMLYWVGAHLVISGALTVGTLVAMGLMVVRIYMPLTSLTNARVDVMTALVSFERVFAVLDLPNPIDDRSDAVELDSVDGRIELRDVTFTYPAADSQMLLALGGAPATPQQHSDTAAGPVLDSVSAVIEPGQTVALVGPSGAGKTTLAALIARLYDVDSGAVSIDGHDVRDVTSASLRSHIGVVSQDPHLFHDTIAANLRYARPGATDEELAAVCRAAHIDELIGSLPEGWNTVVGERGYRLSGGEKQRLAIARVLLKHPAIVVLDEATSHLDSENEALVQSALATALAGRTAVVIAHRLSTIADADQILVLDRGRLVEQGRHLELLAAEGLYADLYRTLVGTDEPAGVA
ncbi:MAG: ABC transporter ATP-binding protein [Acidimicrobiales bacterium]|nr:ABC transporter ATP-binding protein [Acidimicrobiales bacterium]MYA83464.1 ABC transporter ATP-binding protein [Acidimicrobiales bacterium]MYB81015.1 ABC transporter ATP-binding protein [Acidimicrobiales bacterium]MYH75970.1 ABC transporter ATP-binding protein [Acidimicrobiales bacterium]MYI12348.1 ABC transporter ATP-binding protein [Acidimicrobiales bacterium]